MKLADILADVADRESESAQYYRELAVFRVRDSYIRNILTEKQCREALCLIADGASFDRSIAIVEGA